MFHTKGRFKLFNMNISYSVGKKSTEQIHALFDMLPIPLEMVLVQCCFRITGCFNSRAYARWEFGVNPPLSLIFYENFVTCAKEINCFRTLLAC